MKWLSYQSRIMLVCVCILRHLTIVAKVYPCRQPVNANISNTDCIQNASDLPKERWLTVWGRWESATVTPSNRLRERKAKTGMRKRKLAAPTKKLRFERVLSVLVGWNWGSNRRVDLIYRESGLIYSQDKPAAVHLLLTLCHGTFSVA